MRIGLFLILILGITPSLAYSQITNLTGSEKPGLSIEGDYTLLVTKLPIKLTAPTGGTYYDWDVRYNVEAEESLNSCVIKKAPDGDYTVKVKILTIDFKDQKTTIREEQVKFRLRARSQIDDPDDPPVDPIPDPRPNISNEYGVGIPAFDNAPKGDGVAERLAEVYRQSANFLEGKPSLKAIWLEDEKDNADPDKSVLAWQRREAARVTKGDSKWKKWSEVMNKAFGKTQQERPRMTRSDWAAAFREIAEALEVVE